ncbi:MAG: hypothetical protein D6785_00695 [Planctomycetota bacterium]|nr:MAG: hypothetical protein D6785_00695 [Planctomycetota bacterium]
MFIILSNTFSKAKALQKRNTFYNKLAWVLPILYFFLRRRSSSEYEVVKKERSKMDKEILLKVNDQDIPLNRFASEILISAIQGLVQPLRGVNNPKKIEITIHCRAKDSQNGKGD